MRALLIFNPRAGSGPRITRTAPAPDVDRLLALLTADQSLDIERTATEAAGHATDLARQAVRQRCRVVFALGGDGTQREVAAGLMHSECALGILPAGTANVLAPALGLPADAEACARIYARRPRRRTLDVGICNEQVFLMMASFGLDARSLIRLRPENKRRWGRLAIIAAGLRELIRGVGEPHEITLRTSIGAARARRPLQSGPQTFSATFLAASNIAQYGGSFRLAPGARPDDRRLDLVSLSHRSRLRLVWFALRVLMGRAPHPVRHLGPSQQLEIASPSTASDGGSGAHIPVQLDGDPLRLPSPVLLELQPAALDVLVPGESAAAAGSR